ncbi:MAG TPA: (d)CMP kinase [Gammaproteobacteria bacterium]|nr:(d)CMP kinase [Gammaproteobacteria bacterium]
MGDTVPVITIDGPSGVGKGTIAQLLARELGWHMLDSGALYRLVALGAERRGLALDDEAALAAYAESLPVEFRTGEGATHGLAIYLDGEEVSDAIRTETCGAGASQVAALPAVRAALLARQRAFRRPPGLVADGRDMGTTVFPDAPLKIFLTASAEERAQRRYKQLKEKGIDVSLAALLDEITERDTRDSQRAASPLVPADDALRIDTTSMTIEEVLQTVKQAAATRFATPG